MPKFGLGTVIAAGGAGAYGAQQFSQSGFTGLWNILPNGFTTTVTQASSTPEVAALQNELRRLTGMMSDMARNNNRPTVVQVGSGGRSWTVLIVPTAVGGAALYLYCRLTGSSILDLFYVSRSSLTAFRNTMQESMSKMWEEMKKQKDEIFKVVSSLGAKQDQLSNSQTELINKQGVMDERLKKVDDMVNQLDMKADHTINKVDENSKHVAKLESSVMHVQGGVAYATQGIYLLSSAITEVVGKMGMHNSRAQKQLKQFVEVGPLAEATTASLPSTAVNSLPPTDYNPAFSPPHSVPGSYASSRVPQLTSGQDSYKDRAFSDPAVVATGTSALGLRGVMASADLGDVKTSPSMSAPSVTSAASGKVAQLDDTADSGKQVRSGSMRAGLGGLFGST